MCESLGISSSAYYGWRKRPVSRRAQANQVLLGEIRTLHAAGRGVYGSPKIHRILHRQGRRCSRKRVARLMRLDGLVAKRRRCYKRTTQPDARREAAPNRLAQRFTARRANQVWLADMTYIATAEGWLYLAAVLDLYSRRVVGWSMSARMTDDLTMKALDMALRQRLPQAGQLLHHSDRGCQYTSRHYQRLLKGKEIQVSMSGTGNCYDNAPMESFFSLLKTELVHHERYTSRRQARSSLFDYIEVFYNRQRVHSAIGYLAPAQYEEAGQAVTMIQPVHSHPLPAVSVSTQPFPLNCVSTKTG